MRGRILFPSYPQQRAYPRYEVDTKVLISSAQRFGLPPTWIHARTLGEGGLGAEIPILLDTNAVVLLDLLLDKQIVTVPASVRYNIGKFHGFAFVDIGEDSRTTIRRYCHAHA